MNYEGGFSFVFARLLRSNPVFGDGLPRDYSRKDGRRTGKIRDGLPRDYSRKDRAYSPPPVIFQHLTIQSTREVLPDFGDELPSRHKKSGLIDHLDQGPLQHDKSCNKYSILREHNTNCTTSSHLL